MEMIHAKLRPPQASFPASKECLGSSEEKLRNVGNYMAYYALAENSEVLTSSSVCSVTAGSDPNRRLIDMDRNEGSMNDREPQKV